MKRLPVVIILTVVAILGIAVWAISFPVLIHKDAIKNEIKTAFESATGLQLEIQGDTTLHIYPSPHLTVESLYVVNAQTQNSKAPFLLTIKSLNIWPVFTSLFKSKILIKKLQIDGMDISIENYPGGKTNLQEVSDFGKDSAPEPSGDSDGTSIPDILCNDAHVSFLDTVSGVATEFNDIKTSYHLDTVGNLSVANGSFHYMDRPVAVSLQAEGGIGEMFSPESTAIKLSLTSEKDTLAYNGKAGSKSGKEILNGALQISTEDFSYWFRLFRGDKLDNLPAGYQKLPLAVSAKIAMETGNRAAFTDIVLDGDTIKGTAAANFMLPNRLALKAAISKLNLETIIDNGIIGSFNKPAGPALATRQPDSSDIAAEITIGDIVYNHKDITNTSFTADISNSELTIPQLLTTLPGNSRLSFSGIGTTKEDGLTVEGQADIEGNSFIGLLGIFKSPSFQLPANDFKRFHIRANTLISSKEVRFSELIARIEGMGLSGGFITRLGDRNVVQTALAVKGMNLDHIGELWGMQDWKKLLLNYNKTGENSDGTISVWLKKLGYDIQVSTALENYVLNGNHYHTGNFSLSASAGRLELGGEKIPYNDSLVTGRISIDVLKPIPEINLKAEFDQYNADRYFPPPAPGTPRWPTDIFDMKWLDLVTGKFDLKFGHFKFRVLDLYNMSISGGVNDETLSVDSFKATMNNAALAGKLSMSGGAIPTLSTALTVIGMPIERLAPLLPMLAGATGMCNLDLQLATNGVNALSWISNLKGSLGFRGRDIGVHGLNLAGVIRAVSYVRSVADIANVVKRSFPSGNTTFSQGEASWDISQGIISSTTSTMNNEQADATIASKFDLVHWTTDIAARFLLKPLDPTNPPYMIVKMTGDIDNPTLDFDTTPLEQYVNNKSSEKMLQKYGTH